MALKGEQLLTLRKGGIREENRHFEIEHDRFFLYPTFDHQRNDCVRDAHPAPLCGRERSVTTTTVPTVAERVQAGAAWLDEHESGWVDRIDLDRLDINSECQCILGQLHGSYKAAPPVQDAADANGAHYGVLGWAIPLGFGLDWWDCKTDGRELTAAWRELIATRRAAQPDQPAIPRNRTRATAIDVFVFADMAGSVSSRGGPQAGLANQAHDMRSREIGGGLVLPGLVDTVERLLRPC